MTAVVAERPELMERPVAEPDLALDVKFEGGLCAAEYGPNRAEEWESVGEYVAVRSGCWSVGFGFDRRSKRSRERKVPKTMGPVEDDGCGGRG